jgi:Tol biopolymer transport system component
VAARVLATGANELVSAPAAGPLPEDLEHAYARPGSGSLTPDARFAVFEAGHDGLGVADRRFHVFRRDQRSGRTVLVDRADGPAGFVSSEASSPAQSADGRIVAFATPSALSPADKNGTTDIYVRDLVAGTTRLVSRTPAGSAGNGESELPVVSADGRRVAFETEAADLGDGDTDATFDIHMLDLATGTMTWVSRNEGAGGGDAYNAAIDADGSVVAFTSEATNLDPADKDTAADVYARDLAAGTTRLVSRRTNGTKAAVESGSATISADGRMIAFVSDADLEGQPEAVRDVFVHDRGAGTTVLASRASGAQGAEGDGPSGAPSISADGRAVAFPTAAGNLGGAGGGIVVRRLDDLTTTAVAPGLTSALSGDGACALITSRAPEVTRSSPDHARAVLRAVRSSCPITAGVDVPGQPGGPGAGPGAGAPVVSRLSLSRTRFAVGRARTAQAARLRTGTVVRFSLDRAATVKLTIQRRSGGRWVRAGVLRRSAGAGANRVRFSGRIGRRALRPGRHRIVARAHDSAGRTSAPRRARFRIARAR